MQKDKSGVIQAAVALMEARNVGMATSEEWANLADAVEAESGLRIEPRRIVGHAAATANTPTHRG